MMKKIVLSLVWICGLTGFVSAQTFTNTRILKQAAVEYKLVYEANYLKALSMAKQKGWDITIKGRNGNLGVLVGVDDFGFPKYYMTNNNTIAAATTRANQLWPGGASGLNLSGSSANMKNKLAIWDGGSVLGSHVELTGRVTQKDNPASVSDHSTHVAGTMIASGVNPSAKGMAFGIQGMIAYDFNADLVEILNEAPNILLSNHSYSIISGWSFNDTQNRWEFNGSPNDNEDYKFGYYSDDSQALDSIAYNAPFYLIVKSAGNNRDENGPAVGQPYFRRNASGQMVSAGNRPGGISNNDAYDIISWDCGAKNILTVGAVGGLPNGYTRKEDVALTSFSSWGPTDDGRIKPDVVADGVNVLSSISTSTTSYASYSGTSMSSPNATGSLLLLQEYYSKLKAGAFLRSATLKGLAIHTANEAGLAPGPDYQYGWGLLNVEKAAAVITAAVPSNNASTSAHLLFENNLTQGQTFTTTVIASGKGQLQATICWTDVKGAVDKVTLLNNRAKNLVNDLDVRITKGSGATLRTYLPWTLDVNNPGASAVPGDNITDNVERIDIDSTVPGQTYTITVTHKGTLARGSQAYSLLVSGVGGTAYCTSASGGGGARIDSVSFKTIHVANSTGSKTYTDNTKYIADVEPAQTIPIAVKVSTADATTNAPIVKVFIDYNNNGVFDASELAATSGVLTSAAQIYSGSIVTPGNLTVGSIYLMRIIVQETSTATDINACGSYGKGETQDYRVRVVPASNDMLISQILNPGANACGTSAQYLTVTLRNNGANQQSNIPITATVLSGSTTTNYSFTYPGPIDPYTSVNYTFQSPFVTAGGTILTITATAALATDQNTANNTLVSTIATSPKPAISAAAEICGTTVNLKVSNSNNSNYFWFSTATGNTPFAVGPSATTTTIPADKTYYVQSEVTNLSIGPVNKTVLNATTSAGAYRTGNFMKFNNTVPLLIETARLYVGFPGRVRVTVGTITSQTATSFSYTILDANDIDVYATTPNPVQGGAIGNLAADTGAIFRLNLSVPATGDHILFVQALDKSGNVDTTVNGAVLFRNNGLTGATYPIAIPNIMSLTGNSATDQEPQFYYYFYDMKISTGCASDRVAVIAATAPVPVITQQADSLVSSIASGSQWYLNDTAITGANANHFKPTRAGKYKVIVTDAFGCQQISNVITYAVTATIDVQAREINLIVSPNPNNGIFNLSFEVTTKADLSIDILSSSGQRVYNSQYPNFTGKFSKTIEVDQVSSEFYILKIQHNKKTYVQKILIQR
jgi:hypothetical protein